MAGFLPTICLVTFLGALVHTTERDRSPRFTVDVDMVVVRVTVTDPLNRYVTGLGKEHFNVFESKVEQSIIYFSLDKSPISVGIIMDSSGSMGDNMVSARNSVVRFLEDGNGKDEYFLVAFNDRTSVVQDFTAQSKNLQNELAISKPNGRTALYDAIYLGLEKMHHAHHEKKALIIITDGEDNSSRYTFSELKEFVRESDVQLYVIGERGDLGYGRSIITEIIRLTGGRAFFPNSFNQLDYFVDLIHTELRNQYLLGYLPTNQSFNGKWRKIKVKLDPPEGLPRLIIRSKKGYFAPTK